MSPEQNLLRMACLYATKKDLIDRLHGTYVRYKGEIKHAQYHISDEGKEGLYLNDIHSRGKGFHVEVSDSDLDVSSFEVGYVNIDQTFMKTSNPIHHTLYMGRYPAKRYRQGFSLPSYCIRDISGTKTAFGISDIRAIEKSLYGEFPSVKDFMSSEKIVSAVSSNVALKKEPSGIILVYVNQRNVAFIVNKKLHFKEDKIRWIYERVLMKTFGDSDEVYYQPA